jgi:hypothetical protein
MSLNVAWSQGIIHFEYACVDLFPLSTRWQATFVDDDMCFQSELLGDFRQHNLSFSATIPSNDCICFVPDVLNIARLPEWPLRHEVRIMFVVND